MSYSFPETFSQDEEIIKKLKLSLKDSLTFALRNSSKTSST